MKEERNGTSKNNWSRIFRKKWFFPAVYLTIAALLLTVVIWYQSVDNQLPDTSKDPEATENYNPNLHDEDATSVLEQQEVIKMPVTDGEQAEIVTKFYDYNADQEDKEKALILLNNRFYQSTGIDIATAEGKSFDVLAALSGTVTEVKVDPLLGNVVTLSHVNDVVTHYASLGEVHVKKGSKVKQGETLGTAGKNQFNKDSGTHVHFEIRKNGKQMNPEVYFNQPVSKLDEAEAEDVKQEDTEKDEEVDVDEQDPVEE